MQDNPVVQKLVAKMITKMEGMSMRGPGAGGSSPGIQEPDLDKIVQKTP